MKELANNELEIVNGGSWTQAAGIGGAIYGGVQAVRGAIGVAGVIGAEDGAEAGALAGPVGSLIGGVLGAATGIAIAAYN